MSNKLKATTDFFIWLLFITTLLATVVLIVAGTYQMIANPAWSLLKIFVAALLTLGMHFTVRQMPQQGGGKITKKRS